MPKAADDVRKNGKQAAVMVINRLISQASGGANDNQRRAAYGLEEGIAHAASSSRALMAHWASIYVRALSIGRNAE